MPLSQRHLRLRILLLSILMMPWLLVSEVQSQTIDVGPPDTSLCNGQSVTLTAVTTGVGTDPVFTNLAFSLDDQHGGVVDIGFDFEFYGNTYNQCVVSTNGYITFDLNTANTTSPYQIDAASPTPGVPDNAIMFPWQDINPGAGSGGTNVADCGDGTFVVDFVNIAMFSCISLNFTMQAILYQGSNIIDTYITNKPICSTWNGGAAIHGLEGPGGTQAVIVPGRNYPTQWAVTNDAVRFTPDGNGSYTIDQTIPFNPIPVGTEVLEWTDGNGNVLGGSNSITVTPSQPTWYYCNYRSACAAITVTDSIFVTVGNANITAEKQDVSCFGSGDGSIAIDPVGSLFPVSVNLQDTSGQTVDMLTNVTDPVAFGGMSGGDYSITVTDAVGCETMLDVSIAEPAELVVSAAHRNVLCTGDNNGMAYVSVSGGTPPYDRKWSDPMQQTTDTISNLGPGPYSVTVIDSLGCSFDTVMVVTQPLPLQAGFTVGADTCNRQDGAVQTLTLGGTPPFSYIWSFIADSLYYEVNDLESWNLISHLATGKYSVTVVDSNGCELVDSVNVPLILPPQAGFSSRSKPEDLTNPVVEFFNESTASESYEWHFGDGDVAYTEHPEHAYSIPGDFLVMLIAHNEARFGCSDTAYNYMSVDPLFTFYVPNSFTPDGDQLNDEFLPVGENFEYESYNLKIYDRWGKLVWQTDNPEKGWDGTNQSSLENVKNGLYIYIFTLKKFNNFEPKVIRGSVNLYRTR